MRIELTNINCDALIYSNNWSEETLLRIYEQKLSEEVIQSNS